MMRPQTPRAGRDPARGPGLRDDDPELLLEPDLPLRPDPRAQQRRHDDRPVPGEHGRQGLLQGPLLLRARARAGAVRAAVLRHAEPRRRRIVDGRARGAAEPPGRRDDLPDRPVGATCCRGCCCCCSCGAWPTAIEPGYGAAAAVALGLGTMVLPLSTLLFATCSRRSWASPRSALMLRERDGPPSAMLLALAGLAMGYAVASEYPTVLRRDRARPVPALTPRRADAARWSCAARGAYIAGGLVGIVPLLLYNHYAFHSWTHLAYSRRPPPAERLLRYRACRA